MGDDELERLLRAGMDADEPPPDLVSERVSSLRARLDDELSDHGPTLGAEPGDEAHHRPIVDLRPVRERPGRNTGMWRRVGLAGAAAVIVVGLVVVGTRDDGGTRLTTTGPDEVAECTTGVELATPGQLTVATGTFGGPPWKIGDPSEGRGFGPAVMSAVADQLGFADEVVDWDPVGYEYGTTPGLRFHDVFMDVVPITERGEAEVDLTDPYYDVELVLVAPDDSPLAEATGVADLHDARLLAAGFTNSSVPGASVRAARSLVDSPDQVTVFDTVSGDDLGRILAALSDGSADGMIIDLPSVGALSPDLLPDSDPGRDRGQDDVSAVAVLPRTESLGSLGMVLADGSLLTRCINRALAALEADGTLADLESEWLRDGGSIPTLTD